MTKTIRILTLLALMVIGAGQAWAKTEPDLGKIVYTQTVNDHGTLSFYADETCQTAISNPGNGLNSSGLTPVEDGSNVIGYKVYIKATPDLEYTLGAADEGGKVTFIKAEVTVETNVAGARTRGTAPTVGVGDFLDVTATTTTGVYCMTMPADKNLNLLVTATFVVKPMNTAAISYIDADGESKSKDAETVYILDGTETTLGRSGYDTANNNKPYETWYVCNTAVDTEHPYGLAYDHGLALYGNVHLILADGCKMTVTNSSGNAINSINEIAIHGQSTGNNAGSLIAEGSQYGIYTSSNIAISGGQVTASGTNQSGINSQAGTAISINSCIINATGANYGIYASGNITISGGQVTASGTNQSGINSQAGTAISIINSIINATGAKYGIYGSCSEITISGGAVIATGTSDGGIYCGPGKISITDCNVTATGGSYGIYASGIITISGEKVEAIATGTNGNGIYTEAQKILITDCEVTATGGSNGIKVGADVTINGGKVTATGTSGSGIESGSASGINITGCEVNATGGSYGIKVGADVTINGGKVTATSTSGSGIESGSASGINITGCEVNTEGGNNGIKGGTDVTINGGKVTANGTSGSGIESGSAYGINITGCEVNATGGSYGIKGGSAGVTISGGQVEAKNTGSNGYGIYSGINGITLGWTNATDYIYARNYSGPVSIVDGQRFVAYNMANEGDISATAIVSGSSTDATPTFTLDAIARKTLKPLDGYTVSTTGDITLTVGETAKTADFTITTGEGNEAITTYYYNIAANTTVTLGYYSNSALQLDYTAKKTSDNSNVTNTVISGSTLTMPAYDVTIGIRPFQVGVSYIDPTQTGDARNATTPAGTIVSVLDGTETSLNAGWYICNTPLNYNGLTLKGDVHLILADNGAMTFGTADNPISRLAISGQNYNLTIYGQSEGTGALSMYTTNSNNAIFANGISICGGRVTAITKGTSGISTRSSVNICGGEVTAKATYTNDTQNIRAIHSNGTVSISGGTVTVTAESSNSQSADGIYGVQGVSISGGTVEVSATGGSGRGIGSGGSNSLDYAISISGGKVTACATGGSNSYGIYAMNNNIILGWTSADDYIYATSYSVTGSHSVKIAEGKHFVAYTPSGTPGTEGFDPSITGTTAIPFVSGSSEDSNPTFTLAGIAGKTLKPTTVTLNEGNGNGDVITLLEGETSIIVASLDYDRTLTAPGSGSGDVTIDNTPAKLYTTCQPEGWEKETGVKYYTLSSVSGSTLHFNEIDGDPQADTPYLVAVTGNSNVTEHVTGNNVTLKKIVTGSSTSDGSYTMMGTQTGLTNSDAISAASGSGNATYILQTGSTWGKVTDADPTTVYIPPFRAYIVGPAASSARELNSSFDGEAAGIDTLRLTDSDGTEHWYDLNGRRIEKPTRKGIYIRNGKKEIRK